MTTGHPLIDARTTEILGDATAEQLAASIEAARIDGGNGVITVDEDGNVLAAGEDHDGPRRRVYVAFPDALLDHEEEAGE